MAPFRKTETPELAPGDTLGPYRLEGTLGEGGMGIVFRAVHEPDDSVVALKVLKRRLTGDDTYKRRFEHEARAAQGVDHPHLVPVIDHGETEGRYYLACQYVSGRTLADRLRDDGPLSLEELVRLVAHIGSAIDALHRTDQHLVHRDIKPSNIMIDDKGSAALTDFGLAKGRAFTVLTKPGQVMGTLDYLAPELIRGQPATPASDIYAFGCVVFHSITGSPPFGHKGVFEVGVAHLEEEPPDPLADRPDLPPRLSWAVLQALAKDPAARPPTATTYANIIRASAKGATQ